MAVSSGGAFLPLDCKCYESKRESIFIDTAVRGTEADGLQMPGRSLDYRIWTYFGSYAGNGHHERTGGGIIETGHCDS